LGRWAAAAARTAGPLPRLVPESERDAEANASVKRASAPGETCASGPPVCSADAATAPAAATSDLRQNSRLLGKLDARAIAEAVALAPRRRLGRKVSEADVNALEAIALGRKRRLPSSDCPADDDPKGGGNADGGAAGCGDTAAIAPLEPLRLLAPTAAIIARAAARGAARRRGRRAARKDSADDMQKTLFHCGFTAWKVPRDALRGLRESPRGRRGPRTVRLFSSNTLPKGAVDIYGGLGDKLFRFRPRTLLVRAHQEGDGASVTYANAPLPKLELELYAMSMASTEEHVRRQAEDVLHSAWGSDTKAALYVSKLLDLVPNTGMTLRSGRQTGRHKAQSAANRGGEKFLVWEQRSARRRPDEDSPGKLVAAMVLRTKRPSTDEDPNPELSAAPTRGGFAFIEYVAALRSQGGRGWPMILAAEAICRQRGFGALYSAADLAQDGRYADASGTSAKAAHERWGFRPISEEDWTAAGLDLYDSTCSVAYMVKFMR